MRKTKFTLESYGDTAFEGYTQDDDWNGFACPYFTFEETEKIVKAHKITGQNAGFSEELNGFYFEIQDTEEFYQLMEIGEKKVFPIGNSSWIREELENQTKAV